VSDTTLNLDARQRAMLDEMGVKVWWPTAPLQEPVPTAMKAIAGRAGAPGVTARFDVEAVAEEAPRSRPARAAPVAAPTARTPVAAAHGGAHTVLLEPAQRLYVSEGPATGGWLVVVDMPPGTDGQHGEAFAGDAGKLLDNMLRALRLDRATVPVHLARVHRGAAGGDVYQPLATGFAAQAEALAPAIVLALGPLAAQGLMDSVEPLGKLRGGVRGPAPRPGTPLVASYHPVYLLRNPADKAKAWADLCLAAAQLDAPTS
jgi:uracil-DNA glycosylase family 4